MKMMIDIVSCVFSAIAIIVSIITLKKTNKTYKDIAKSSLNTKFFEEIYFKEIIIKLPNILSKINSGVDLYNNCEEAEELVTKILEKSLFYKYFDETFYNNIRSYLIKIDEILVQMKDKKLEEDSLGDYKSDLEINVNKFYNDLKEYYFKI